jgi:hypothetical protein
MCTLKSRGARNKPSKPAFLVEQRSEQLPSLLLIYFFSMSYQTVLNSCPWFTRALSLACLFTFALPSALKLYPQDPAPTAPSDLFAHVIANQKTSEAFLDEYERTQKVEKRKAGNDPQAWNTTVTRLIPAGPGMGKLVLSVDSKPTDPVVYRAELQKLEQYILWAAQDGPAQKDAYAKAERKRKERFDLIEATHQAFLFKLEGQELRDGRTLLRYSMVPNPDYHATTRNTLIFSRVRGTLWVDQQSSQLAKIDGSVTEDFTFALFLAKVYKGSHFMQERYEVAPGVWEPTFEQYDFDGRKFMVSFSIHERTFYSDYKRIGPPKEAAEAIHAELDKLTPAQPPAGN